MASMNLPNADLSLITGCFFRFSAVINVFRRNIGYSGNAALIKDLHEFFVVELRVQHLAVIAIDRQKGIGIPDDLLPYFPGQESKGNGSDKGVDLLLPDELPDVLCAIVDNEQAAIPNLLLHVAAELFVDLKGVQTGIRGDFPQDFPGYIAMPHAILHNDFVVSPRQLAANLHFNLPAGF